ncbi:hypothetical protein AX16_007890 [Volvariella volvacea WC 439]|nr:hypothetical protein AX16_007890 [Volvariella volvacea WC 439]
MLRLAFSRSAHRVFQARPALLSAQLRGNATAAPLHPSQNGPAAKSSAEDELLFNELQKELDSMVGVKIEPSIKDPQQPAQTEAELFGLSSIAQNGQLDPKMLPLREPLEGQFTEEQYAATLIHGRGIRPPIFHPRTHDIPVANIQFRSHHPRLLDLFTHFATHAAYSLGIPVSKPYYLPTKRTLWTVLRSPFAHKKSQENFERKVHKRGIKAWDADPEVVARWVQYLRRHALGGVGMRVTRWEHLPLGVGASRLDEVDSFLRERPGASEAPASVAERTQKIKALGEKIIREESGEIKRTISSGTKN